MPNTLTLISHPLCPFVQRAAIVLMEKAVPFHRIQVDLAAKPDWFLTLSPTGKVPLLLVVEPDGTETTIFESMVICEYLEETQLGSPMYSASALLRARQRGWTEFAGQALSDIWQFLHATDRQMANARQTAVRTKLERLESEIEVGPHFGGMNFSMVDAVFGPIFRYFDVLDPALSLPLFRNLPRVSAWRAALSVRPSIINAVGDDYAALLKTHLRKQLSIHMT
ncbi:glutathione S-transferase [Xanthomonas campestris]|uniref:glutathione S-transferase family protein n=1 Tax=Xanthomonas campestris TaxID=339 RepID=UPI000E1E30DF|nr:glutathione S-transferase family protein [Xanthomonas campestris]MCC5067086.1 glutathione S-transferase family protein [Xanthomonas campestris]MCC5087095.1 glutathione S-transferase family protein [Xanthomonas campestris]MEB2230959.1 glutathione S-transferase family protein [Xanthomonas campestris pv. campestris]RJU11190.1 glutathione S-transferase [Xanthomonas campestris]